MLWYVKQNGKVVGQFPTTLISEYLQQGKFDVADEASPDQINWVPMADLPDLMPGAMPVPETEEELETAKWQVERAKASVRWEGGEVHEGSANSRSKSGWGWAGGTVIFLLIAGVVATSVLRDEPLEKPLKMVSPLPTCTAAAAPGVNWNGCDKNGALLRDVDLSGAILNRALFNSADLSNARLISAKLSGADLSYATLTRANLSGANLSGANLSFAELREADLTGADLRDANLSDTVLDGAKLERAQWTDGRVCAAGSVGQCL